MLRTSFVALVVWVVTSAFASPAHAFPSFTDILCGAAKASPAYWILRGGVEVARDAGSITTRDDCMDSLTVIGDAPGGGSIGACVCRDVFPATSQQPVCPIAHNVCTVGSALPPDMAMRTDCAPSASMMLAAQVCEVDPFCCSTFWDDLCVQRVTPVFWENAGDYVQNWVQSRADCQITQSNFPRTPEAIALFLQQCPDGRIHPQTALVSATNAANGTAASFRNSDAVCLGPAPSPLFSVGEFVLGDFNFNSDDRAGDWDVGFHKAECAPGFVQMGLSTQPWSPQVSAVLCQMADANRFTGNHTAMLALPGDRRRGQRLGDWDPGFSKLECGNNEYVYATSQHPTEHHLHGLACAQSTRLSNNGCRSVAFSTPMSSGSGNWDMSSIQADCAPHEYIAGMSADGALMPHALLCCAR